MPSKKYDAPAMIGISTDQKIKDRFDSFCLSYGLKRSEMFEHMFDEWLRQKNMKPLTE